MFSKYIHTMSYFPAGNIPLWRGVGASAILVIRRRTEASSHLDERLLFPDISKPHFDVFVISFVAFD
jgi:hypothetical protein